MVVLIVVGALILAAVALALSYLGGTLEDESVDAPDAGIPGRELTADDIPRLRFRVGLRGYRMADVDAALDRLEHALRTAQRSSPPEDPRRFSAGDDQRW